MPIRSSARGAPSLELRARPAVADATIAHRAGERRTFRVIPRHRFVFPHIGARPRVLVPVLMGQMARPAISIGDALATSPGGSGSVLGLVELRAGRGNEVLAQGQRRRRLPGWLAAHEAIAPRTSLAGSRGGSSARVLASTASALADACGSALTLTHIQTDSQHPDRSRREWDSFEQIVAELHRPSANVRVHHHENAATGLLEEATGQDLVVIGSRLSPSKPDIPIGRA